MLWEWSNNRIEYNHWIEDSKIIAERGGYITNDQVNAQFLASRLAILRGYIAEISTINHVGQDLPIGFEREDSSFWNKIKHDVAVIVLTREAIESELAARDVVNGLVPGTIPVSFRDKFLYNRSDKGGDYMLYLQVERMP